MKLKELAILLGVPKEDRGELEAVLKAMSVSFLSFKRFSSMNLLFHPYIQKESCFTGFL